MKEKQRRGDKRKKDNIWSLFPTQNYFAKQQTCKKKQRRGNEYHVNEKKRTSTYYLEVVPDSGPKRAATPDLNRWQTEWKLIRLEKTCFQAFRVVNI